MLQRFKSNCSRECDVAVSASERMFRPLAGARGHAFRQTALNVATRFVMLRVGFFLLLATLGPVASASAATAQPEADLIFHHGKILTVDREFSIGEALAVRDGRVVAVGSDSAILIHQRPLTTMVDFRGR